MTDEPTDVDAPTANGWTKTEMKALQEAMRLSFGSCTCMQLSIGHGRVAQCDGHAFLSEMDIVVDRPTHMLLIRRDIDRFRWDEFTGRCTNCGKQDAMHDIDRWDLDDGNQRVCIECIHARHMAEIEASIDRGDAPPPATLPW